MNWSNKPKYTSPNDCYASLINLTKSDQIIFVSSYQLYCWNKVYTQTASC